MTPRIVFADVETSGLDHARHQIIQVAAVAVDADWREIEAVEIKLRFDMARAEPSALEKNRYDPEVWAREAVEQRLGREIFRSFLARHSSWTRTSAAGRPYQVARMGGQNFRFDAEFFATWFDPSRAAPGCGLPGGRVFCPGALWEGLCTLSLARWVTASLPPAQQPANHQLETLCRWAGIDLAGIVEARRAELIAAGHLDVPGLGTHDAMVDIRATVQLARHLVERCGLGWLGTAG